MQTDYHKSRARSIQSKDISNILNLQEESGSKRKNRVHRSELVLCKFVAEHDLSLRILEHLPKLITSVAPDSNIAKEIQCSRTKGTELITNKIGLESFNEILEHLRSNKYSLILDESTDMSVEKQLASVVRTIDNKKKG